MKRLKTILFSLLFLCSINIFSQETYDSGLGKNKFISNMLSVNIGAPVLNRLEIFYEGVPMLNSKYTFAPLFEIEYYKNIYKSFGLKAGGGFNFVPFNTYFSFKVDDENGISGDFNESQYEYNIVSFNLYLLVSNTFSLSNKISGSIDIGVKSNSISNNSLPIEISYSYYNFKRETFLTFLSFIIFHNRNCYSLLGNFNLYYHLTAKSMIFSGLTFNYSPVNIAYGYYAFDYLPWESYGTVNLGIDYFGLKFGYVFLF